MPEEKLTLVLRVFHSVQLGGLWYGTKGDSVHVFGIFSKFSFLTVFALQFFALVLAKDDPSKLFECFSVFFFCGIGILKLYSLHQNRKHWQRLLDRMSRLERDQMVTSPKLQTNEESQFSASSFVKIYTKSFERISIILIRIYRSTAVIFILAPFLEYALLWYLGDRPEEYPHILPGWHPLDKKHIVFYVIMVLFEVVAAVYCVFVHEAFDSASIGVMIFVCGQFSSLKVQCSRIGGRGTRCLPSSLRDARAHFRIAKCHSTHILLVKLIGDLDLLLKNILGMYFFLATLTLCTVAMRLTSEQMSVMQIVSLLQYMCATLTQLFLFCSYGDAVYNESSLGQGEGPFCSALWCLGPKTRREVALLSFGMMLPRRLHASPFNAVDLPTFIQIVRTAYSYYALLGNIKAT